MYSDYWILTLIFSNEFISWIIMKWDSWIQIWYREFISLWIYVCNDYYAFNFFWYEFIYMNSYAHKFINAYIHSYVTYNHFIYEVMCIQVQNMWLHSYIWLHLRTNMIFLNSCDPSHFIYYLWIHIWILGYQGSKWTAHVTSP